VGSVYPISVAYPVRELARRGAVVRRSEEPAVHQRADPFVQESERERQSRLCGGDAREQHPDSIANEQIGVAKASKQEECADPPPIASDGRYTERGVDSRRTAHGGSIAAPKTGPDQEGRGAAELHGLRHERQSAQTLYPRSEHCGVRQAARAPR
jgi:hypothetical protein